jgi:hypothetical protein
LNGKRGFTPAKIDELSQFQEELRINKDKFMWFYYNYFSKITVPFAFNETDSFTKTIGDTLRDLCIRVAMSDHEKTREGSLVLTKYYGLGDECAQLIEARNIQSSYNDAQFRRKVNEYTIDDASYELKGVNLHDGVKKKISYVFDQYLYTNKIMELFDKDDSVGYIKRLIEFIGGKLMEVDGEYYLLRKQDNVDHFRVLYKDIQQALYREIEPITRDNAIRLVLKEYKKVNKYDKSEIRSKLKVLLKNHAMIEYIDMEDKLQVKWEFLSSVLDRVKRILLEDGSLLKRKDILDKYNYLAIESGIETLNDNTLLIRSDDYIYSPQDGYWKYTNKKKSRIASIDFIRLFVKENGGVATLDEIKHKVDSYGYILPLKSLRANISVSCLVSKSDKNLYVLEEDIDLHPSIKVRRRRQKDVGNKIAIATINIFDNDNSSKIQKGVLIEQLKAVLTAQKVEIADSNLYEYLRRFTNNDEYPFIEEEGYIFLDKEKLQKIDINQIGKRKEPAYKSIIRSYVINYLKEKDNFQETKSNLFQKFNTYLPENIKTNVFYKIINDPSYFEQVGKGQGSSIRLKQEVLTKANLSLKEASSEVVVQYFRRKEYRVDELIIKIKTVLNYGYTFTNEELEVGVNSFIQSLAVDNEDYWSRTLLQTIYDYWFSNIDQYDKDTIFFKLAMSFETYLRRFGDLKNIKGLSAIINSFKEIRDVQSYKYDIRDGIVERWNVDKTKENFSYYMGSLMFFRNLFAHEADDDRLFLKENKRNGTIENFIALYIYTAYLLRVD